MIGLLYVLAYVNLIMGLVMALALWPEFHYYPATLPLAYLPSEILIAEGVLGCIALLVVAEGLEHLRAIRGQLVPVTPEPTPEAV